jgi:type II secretory pathway component PulM
MREWFASLQERERLIFIAGAAAATLIVVWAFGLRPLRAELVELRETVADKQRLVIDIGRVQALASSGETPSAQPGEQSLVVLVDNTAQTFGLSSPRTRPDGADGVNVAFQGVPFDALLSWLIALETTYGVAVESASFSSARERGLVNGQLFLRRS